MTFSSKIISVILFFFGFALQISCNGQDSKKGKVLGNKVDYLYDEIWDVFQDHDGNYWFGSNGDGVFVYDGESLIQYKEEDGLMDNSIRGFQSDGRHIFVETPRGVSKYDGERFVSLELEKSSEGGWGLQETDLWFNCNGNALYRYDGEKLYELFLPLKDLREAFGRDVYGVGFSGMNNSPYAVYGINKDESGNMWFGTITAGAYRYDGKSFLWVAEQELSTLPDGRVPGVRSILEDKDGYLWLSNFISKYKIIEEGDSAVYEKLEGMDMSSSLFEDRIGYFNSGLRDKDGNLWMTTFGGGVWKYDGEELFNYPIMDGEEEALLVSIYMDNNGVLWLGTNNVGVYRHNGEDFEKFHPWDKEKEK